jgi:hypothetical protein
VGSSRSNTGSLGVAEAGRSVSGCSYAGNGGGCDEDPFDDGSFASPLLDSDKGIPNAS